jgi:tight adherence protein C
MAVTLLILGASLVGLTVWLLIRALAIPRLKIDAHLQGIEKYGFEGSAVVIDTPSPREQGQPALGGLAESLGRSIAALLPALRVMKRGELTAAGIYEISPETVHGYRVLSASMTLIVVLGYAVVLSGGVSALALAVGLVAAVLGWLAPAAAIRRRGAARLAEIDRELPELIDLLVATVEAGLGLGGSFQLVSGRFKGPLGEELRNTLKQQSLGISNQVALNDMVERVDTPSVRAFARTVVRAETMGVSIGPIMRNLASDMRRRRRQAAQERVQKVPIKMLFPLIFLIFPALFIVLLYPALYTITTQLGSGI